MKKLSDYQGDAAIELWADLLDPFTAILSDKDLLNAIQSGKPRMLIAKDILKSHPKEAVEILQRIDPEPVDGLNIVTRLVWLFAEIGQNETIKSFFGYAEQAKEGDEFGGSPTENTEADEK